MLHGVTPEQIDAMAIRCRCKPRDEYREIALAESWREENKGGYSEEELKVRRTGRTTTILLAALHKAEESGEPVYFKGASRDLSIFMRDLAKEMALSVGINTLLFKIPTKKDVNPTPLFEDHTLLGLP